MKAVIIKKCHGLLEDTSMNAEVTEGWEKWVCEPIIKYPLAPRYAKAVLIIIGYAMSKGISIHTIVKRLIRKEVQSWEKLILIFLNQNFLQ